MNKKCDSVVALLVVLFFSFSSHRLDDREVYEKYEPNLCNLRNLWMMYLFADYTEERLHSDFEMHQSVWRAQIG